jgi:hypothetical protein
MKYLTSVAKNLRPALVLFGLFVGVVGSNNSLADFKVYSPYVEQDTLEIEARGHIVTDRNPERRSARQDKMEVGYGVTSWWATSLFTEYEREPGSTYRRSATAWENIFQLTERGKYWLDAGLYVEYASAAEKSAADTLELKLLLEKNIGKFSNTVNLIFEREIGKNSSSRDVETSYAWRTRYRWKPELEPGIEIYGGLGNLDGLKVSSANSHQAGPVVSGKFRLDSKSALLYQVGYLFGLNHNSDDGAVKWQLEYERHF